MNQRLNPLYWMRSLYDWVISLSESKHAERGLFFLSMAEASFFQIPPDALLIPLCIGSYKRWFRFALICSLGSVVGGMLGYLIGYSAFELIGGKLLSITASLSGSNPDELLETAQFWFNQKEVYGMKVGVWAVGIAGFTPIPYKVFTIAAGFFEMSFPLFIIASVVSRSARFFAVAGAIGFTYKKYGVKIKELIDRYFNLLAISFVILLGLGFWVISLVKH